MPRALRLRALVWSRRGPTAPGSLGRTRHRGDTSWGGGRPSTRKEGPAAGHSQGCRDPRGTRSPGVYPGSTWSQVNAGPGPQGTQLHTAHPPPRPLPRGPVMGCPGNSPQPRGGLQWPTTPRSRDPGKQCGEGEAQTEGGGDLGGHVSGQAWRGKGELLSARALPRETPRGSDGGLSEDLSIPGMAGPVQRVARSGVST